MKHLYLIGGTMGVGKTTVCRELNRLLEKSVFLDGDWCWCLDPFTVNEETKEMVMDNICYLLNNFLRCGEIENVVFCWVLHQQETLDEILSRLDRAGWQVRSISLTCTKEALEARLQKDIQAGLRQPDILARSIPRLGLYEKLNTQKVDTTGKTPAQVAEEILR